MNLNRFLRAIVKRWYVTLAGLLVTAGLCAAAFTLVGPSYERAASELLVPGTTSIPKGGNAYLYLGGLTQASDVLVRALQSETVQGPLLKGHAGTKIQVARDNSTSGPMLTLTVTGASRQAVDTVFDGMLKAVPTTLTALQDDIKAPADGRISALQLTADGQPTVVQKGRMEAIAMAGAGGLALTLLAVGLIDGLLLARADRRARREAERTTSAGTTRSANVVDIPHDDDDPSRPVRMIARK
jgi:hypothetical protein